MAEKEKIKNVFIFKLFYILFSKNYYFNIIYIIKHPLIKYD